MFPLRSLFETIREGNFLSFCHRERYELSRGELKFLLCRRFRIRHSPDLQPHHIILKYDCPSDTVYSIFLLTETNNGINMPYHKLCGKTTKEETVQPIDLLLED